MKSLVIFPEKMGDLEIIKTKSQFFLENIKIESGLVEENDITLEECYDFENTVLVKKRAFSCNYRDKSLLLKSDKLVKEEAIKGDLYFAHIGSDFVGEVIAVGKNVKEFKIGDTVIPNITYPSDSEDYVPGIATNHASVRIEDFYPNKLLKVPANFNIPDEKLAAFPISGFTAYSMIRKVVKPNSKVLVTAAKSNTSLSVITALKNSSAEVYIMTSSLKYMEEYKKMGVKDILIVNHELDNYMDDPKFKEKMEKIGKFDAVIDPFFDIYLPRIIDFMAMNSKYVTCGLYNQFSEFDASGHKFKGNKFQDILFKVMVSNISIIGNCIGLKEDGLKALEGLNNGDFDIIIDNIYSEGEESLFLDRTYNSKERFGKVVYLYKN